MDDTARRIQSIEITAAVLGGVSALALGLFFGVRIGVSSAIGSVVGMANLWALARLVTIIVDTKSDKVRRSRAMVFLGLKFMALIGVVGLLVIRGFVHGAAFMGGISSVAVAIVVGSRLRDDLVAKKEDSIDA